MLARMKQWSLFNVDEVTVVVGSDEAIVVVGVDEVTVVVGSDEAKVDVQRPESRCVGECVSDSVSVLM